jgi:hypothetical protein
VVDVTLLGRRGRSSWLREQGCTTWLRRENLTEATCPPTRTVCQTEWPHESSSAFSLVGLAAPIASFFIALGGYTAASALHFVGPPLYFRLPHNGEVVAHVDVLGRWPPDIARIRVSEAATGETVWDVKPATARSECWNGCWSLTLRAGSNPAFFAAGHQQFSASLPLASSFSLARGTAYLFEVWDSQGRLKRDHFTL